MVLRIAARGIVVFGGFAAAIVLFGSLASAAPAPAAETPPFWDPRGDVDLSLRRIESAKPAADWTPWTELFARTHLRAMLTGEVKPDVSALEKLLSKLRAREADGTTELVLLADAVEDWIAELSSPARADLIAKIRAAGDEFRRIEPDQLAQMRIAAQSAARRAIAAQTQTKVDPNSDASQLQKTLKDIDRALDVESPGRLPLRLLSWRLNRFLARGGHRALIPLQAGLASYVDRLDAAGTTDGVQVYRDHLQTLARVLEGSENIGDDDAQQAAKAIAWLDSAGQQRQIVYAVRRHLAKPNVQVEVTASFLQRELTQTKVNTGKVDDVVLGAQVGGRQVTTSVLSVELVPDARYACFDLLVRGTCKLETEAHRGRVTVSGDGKASFAGRKRVYITPEGILSLPAAVNCRLDAQSNSVDVDVPPALEGIATRLAERAVADQQGEADAITVAHLRTAIAKQIEAEVNPLLDAVDVAFRQRVVVPLIVQRNVLQRIRLHSTANEIVARGITDGQYGLGASGPCPVQAARKAGQDVRLSIHETALNHAWDELAGKLWPDINLAQGMFAYHDDEAESKQAGADSIGFGASPLRWTLGDNNINVRVMVDEHRGEKNESHVLQASYALPAAGEAWTLVRNDGLKDWVEKAADEKRQLLRQQAAGLLFPTNLSLLQLFPGTRQTADQPGSLTISDQFASQGWMVVHWKSPVIDKKVAGEAKASSGSKSAQD